MKKRRFNWINILKSPDDQNGIYAIWGQNICVYVGQAKKQSLQARLLKHYDKSHNEKLNNWIRSSYPLWFTVEPIDNIDTIDAKERTRIKRYAPLTNLKLQKKEYQYGN